MKITVKLPNGATMTHEVSAEYEHSGYATVDVTIDGRRGSEAYQLPLNHTQSIMVRTIAPRLAPVDVDALAQRVTTLEATVAKLGSPA